MFNLVRFFFFFFFNDTATTEIYTLSLHDALPIYFARGSLGQDSQLLVVRRHGGADHRGRGRDGRDRRPLPRPLHGRQRSEEHTSELQSQSNLVCRLLLEKKKI